MKLLITLLLALIVSCGGNPPPQPPEPPDPVPECLPGVAWCHEFDPPRTCSTEAEPCKHNPSTDPAYCELAADCPPGPPDPPPDPNPPQHPDNLPCPPRAGEAGWEVVSPRPDAPTSKLIAVNEAIKALKREKPELFTSAGNCLAGWTGGAEADVFFFELALILSRTNDCAGQFVEDGGKRIDALGILAGGRQDWMEMHLIHYGDGCILGTAAAYKNMWHDQVPYTPPAAPQPQCEGFTDRGGTFQTEQCDCYIDHAWNECGGGTTPDPDPVCMDPDPTGLPAEYVMKHHNQDWDTTYRVKGYDYCTAAGFTNRGTCPLRNEGDPEREECEEKHIGVQQWWCNGVPINARSCDVFEDDCVKADNPAQAKCQAHAKTCTEDGRTCAEADW